MAEAKAPASAAVQMAWRIAAGAARSSGRRIEPAHFLFGIFSLDEVDGKELPATTRVEVEQEVGELQRRCRGAAVEFVAVRGRIRSDIMLAGPGPEEMWANSAGGAGNRSETVRKAFGEAAKAGGGSGGAQICLLALTRSLLEHEPKAAEFLGMKPTDYATFVRSLGEPEATQASADDGPAEELSIFQSLDASAIPDDRVDWKWVGPHFAKLCELSWQCGACVKFETLYEDALKCLLTAIPAAQRAAILMQDSSGNLLLKAHLPKGVLPASSSSARKAMMNRESFIWQRGVDLSKSQLESEIQAGIYAPILSTSETFGVICVDANAAAIRFTREDLFLLTSLGHQLGITFSNRKLEEELRQSAKLLERLMTNFSPKVRERLLLKAEAGRLRLGGEKSVISVLCSDIRGFTLMTAEMETEDVVSLLNDYFSAMVGVVFRHGGSVDKFIGDAMLAVFGSPEADALHAEKSLRAALEMQAEVKSVSARRARAGLQTCEIGIGVHTGEAIHGFIGSPERMEFTVIGSAVNLASRYCDAARGGEVMLSAEMLERVWNDAVVEAVTMTTKHEGEMTAYRLVQMRAAK